MAKRKDEEVEYWDRGFAERARAEGQAIRDNPRSMIPNFAPVYNAEPTGRDVLASALMGFNKGMEAVTRSAALGDPFVAAMSGIAGAGAQPGPDAIAAQRQQMMQAQQLAQLEATPIDTVSPGLVEQYPELKGMPLGLVQKITPLIAETGRKKRAEMVAHAARGGGIYTDPDTGMMFSVKPMHGGNQLIPLPGQSIGPDGKVLFASQEREKAAERPKEIGAEAAVKVSMAQDGLTNLGDIRQALSSPRARELILKAGGSWKALTSLGDPEAEALANAIFQVADAEARIKTGAAINEKEVESYFNALVPKTGTVDGILDRLNRKERYFNSINSMLTTNKRLPGGAVGGRESSVAVMERMARPKGSSGPLQPYVSTDGGKTWRPK